MARPTANMRAMNTMATITTAWPPVPCGPKNAFMRAPSSLDVQLRAASQRELERSAEVVVRGQRDERRGRIDHHRTRAEVADRRRRGADAGGVDRDRDVVDAYRGVGDRLHHRVEVVVGRGRVYAARALP